MNMEELRIELIQTTVSLEILADIYQISHALATWAAGWAAGMTPPDLRWNPHRETGWTFQTQRIEGDWDGIMLAKHGKVAHARFYWRYDHHGGA